MSNVMFKKIALVKNRYDLDRGWIWICKVRIRIRAKIYITDPERSPKYVNIPPLALFFDVIFPVFVLTFACIFCSFSSNFPLSSLFFHILSIFPFPFPNPSPPPTPQPPEEGEVFSCMYTLGHKLIFN